MTVRRGVGVRALLAPTLVAVLAAGLGAAVLAFALRGTDGLVAAGLGVGLVLAFLALGQLPLVVSAGAGGGVGGLLLLLGYASRVVVLLALLAVVLNTDGIDREVLGLTMVAVGLAATVGTVWSWLHWQPAVVDVSPAPYDQDASAQ